MIQIFEYDGTPIQFETINGQVMANATAMFKANNSRLDHWRVAEGTKKYIEAITRNLGFAENQLIVTKRGGVDTAGTWIHEKLILNAARYISTDFELWCDEKIGELLRTGSVSLKSSLPDFTNPAESARAWAAQFEEKQAALQLVEAKERQIQELWPKAQATEELLESHDTVSIGDFAKAINYGQNRLFEELRNDKILIDSGSKHNQPYQSYIDRGYFELQELTKVIKDQRKIFFQTRVTPKGQVYLIKHIESKRAS